MKVLRLCCIAMVGLGLACAAAQAGSAVTPCDPPDDAAGTIGALPKVAEVFRAGGHLRVLAVGSATIFGPEALPPPGVAAAPVSPLLPPTLFPIASEAAFPMQMAKTLQGAVPGLHVEIVLRGGRGMTAVDMLAQIRRALAGGRYQLVLWQTGTVEAVHNTPPGEFAQSLAEGAEAIEAAQANLVLVDPQFSRFLQMNSNLDPYIQALQQTAAMPGVLLFHRFDLMRNWVNEGRMDLERTPKPDRKRTAEALHACLGAYLGHLIMAGARS